MCRTIHLRRIYQYMRSIFRIRYNDLLLRMGVLASYNSSVLVRHLDEGSVKRTRFAIISYAVLTRKLLFERVGGCPIRVHKRQSDLNHATTLYCHDGYTRIYLTVMHQGSSHFVCN